MKNLIKSKLRYWFYKLLKPKPYFKRQIRINKHWHGNNYGGFFVHPNLLNEDSIVYSVGIGEDISFDLSIIDTHGCKVFAFDPTPKSISYVRQNVKLNNENFAFYDFGLSAKSGFVDFYLPKNQDHVSGSYINQENIDVGQKVTVEMKSIQDTAELLGHKRIDVLKMDIEGAEYEVLTSVLKTDIEIGQILVEFHERFFEDGIERTKQIIADLNSHSFKLFAVSSTFEEISFINCKALKSSNSV